MPTLILTPRFTEDSQALWSAAVRLGWDVQRLSSWWVAEEMRSLPNPVWNTNDDKRGEYATVGKDLSPSAHHMEVS